MFNPIQAISKSFVSGILGSGLGGPVAMIMTGAGAGGFGPLKGLLKGLQGLFGKATGAAGANASARPLPFSTANINVKITLNPFGALTGGKGATGAAQNDAQAGSVQNPFQQLTQVLKKLVDALTGGQPGAATGSNSGAAPGASVAPSGGSGGGNAIDSMINKSGSKIDSMMGEAEKLMASDKMADQLKGQRMMQKAMRLFEMISKMLEQRSQMQAKAIQAIK